MRTSKNDPIRVDFLSSADLGLSGRIGLTIAPGKKDPGRDWDRDLESDLERLRNHYETRLLVSLMEEPEYRLLHISDLLDKAKALGIETLSFPIRDVDAPPSRAMSKFIDMVRQILAVATDGHTVVIHCRGGVGRSGTVAAACLVAQGHEPKAAIARVRAVRENAVEVPVQERWVEAFASEWRARSTAAPRTPARSAAPQDERAPSIDTFLGCLLGGAMGDALGYPVEFLKGAEIVRRFGAAAPAKLNYDGHEIALVSDDTQMTLFTAEGIVRAVQRGAEKGICHPPTVMAFALLRWYETQGGQPPPNVSGRGWLITEKRIHERRAPGNTCMSALSQLRAAALPTVDAPPNDSKGCGAVMRVAPCGLAAGTREQAFEWARESGVLTHGHPSGYLSAAYFASLIWDLARGTALLDAMGYADDLLAPQKGKGELAQILARARKLASDGPPDMKTIETLGGGWTGEEALAIALLCVVTFDSKSSNAVENTLWRAAAHSGDSDSAAAITGNLLGAMLGASALPKRWLATLELKDVIERIATDLHRSAILGDTLDFEAYPPN